MDERGTGRSLSRLVGRALLLRCPRCGGRGIRRTRLKLKPRCPSCGLMLERGEASDYWIGAYTINFVVAELVVVALIVGAILATLPAVPWGLVQLGGAAAAVAMPLLFFPFSRTLWLALDLAVRPREPGDRAW